MNVLGRIAAATACAAAAMAVPNLAYAKTAPSCPLPTFGPGSTYHPAIHPSDFSAHVTNRWFPLRPGTTYLYTGTKDGKKALDVVQRRVGVHHVDDLDRHRPAARGAAEEHPAHAALAQQAQHLEPAELAWIGVRQGPQLPVRHRFVPRFRQEYPWNARRSRMAHPHMRVWYLYSRAGSR